MQAIAPPDFISVNDALVARRDTAAAELASRQMARDAIADPVGREIGALFTRKERDDARFAHMHSLREAIRAQPAGTRLPGVGERVQFAFDRAHAQGNYSAVEALERELDQDAEQTALAVLFVLMDD